MRQVDMASLRIAPKNSGATPRPVANADRAAVAMPGAVRVLVVDDETAIIEELVELLADEGYDTLSATSPQQALSLMNEHSDISIVISDIRMPGMDGLELSRKIMEGPRQRAVSVIVLTGHAGMDEAIKALKIGVQDFLTKPVNPEHLVHTVARAAEINRLREHERDYALRLAREVKAKTRESRELSQQLARKNEELEHSNRHLANLNSMKDEFLGMISHELNTPLNAVIGFSQMIVERFRGNGDDKGVELASLVTSAGEHMHRNIMDILLMLEIQAGSLDPLMQEVLVCDLFEAVKNGPVGLKSNPDVTLEVVIGDGAEVILADAQAITRALEVLTHNAMLFSPKDGTVVLAATSVSGRVRLSVRDQGPGMAAEKLARALELLTQGDGSLIRHHEGMGLGIPLAKGLTEAMGGTFEIITAPEKGTEAVLTFPGADPAH